MPNEPLYIYAYLLPNDDIVCYLYFQRLRAVRMNMKLMSWEEFKIDILIVNKNLFLKKVFRKILYDIVD